MDDIHQLIKEGRLEYVKALVIRDKTCVNALEGGWTPLGVACQLGSVEICKVLVNNGAELNKPVNGSWTPLYISCMEGHSDVVELLLKSGADVKKCDDDLDSPLHIACMCGHFGIARLLVDGGAIVDALNKEGRSAMEFVKDDTLIAELRKASVWTNRMFTCGIKLLSPWIPLAAAPVIQNTSASITPPMPVAKPSKDKANTISTSCTMSVASDNSSSHRSPNPPAPPSISSRSHVSTTNRQGNSSFAPPNSPYNNDYDNIIYGSDSRQPRTTAGNRPQEDYRGNTHPYPSSSGAAAPHRSSNPSYDDPYDARTRQTRHTKQTDDILFGNGSIQDDASSTHEYGSVNGSRSGGGPAGASNRYPTTNPSHGNYHTNRSTNPSNQYENDSNYSSRGNRYDQYPNQYQDRIDRHTGYNDRNNSDRNRGMYDRGDSDRYNENRDYQNTNHYNPNPPADTGNNEEEEEMCIIRDLDTGEIIDRIPLNPKPKPTGSATATATAPGARNASGGGNYYGNRNDGREDRYNNSGYSGNNRNDRQEGSSRGAYADQYHHQQQQRGYHSQSDHYQEEDRYMNTRNDYGRSTTTSGNTRGRYEEEDHAVYANNRNHSSTSNRYNHDGRGDDRYTDNTTSTSTRNTYPAGNHDVCRDNSYQTR